MAGEPTDVELIREVLAGRVERFELLIRRYERLVAAAAVRMGVPRQEVEEVANDVFYKVYRSLKRYEPTHAFSTWIYRITVNAALDRKRSRRHEALTDTISPTLADPGASPHEDAERRGRVNLLREALDRVPGHYRAPLVLMHVEGLPIEEVSRALDLPEGTVKSRLFRGRAMLKQIIERHYPALAPAAPRGETR